MNITYVWSDIRDRAFEQFAGESLGAETENAIIEVFERRPALVVSLIEEVSTAKANGKVRSGWAILRSRLAQEESKSSVVVTDKAERDKAVKRIEQWMRAAGIHFDSESELVEELFGEPLGRLKHFAKDDKLRERMIELWKAERPRGEQVEREELERARQWRETSGVLWRKRSETLKEKLAAVSESSQPEGFDPELGF